MDRRHLQALQSHIQEFAKIMQPVVPFVVQASVSMGAYAAGLSAAQGVGSVLRISCSTPVAGPIAGVLGVGFASAVAGQAALACQRVQKEGIQRGLLAPGVLIRSVRPEHLIADAILGIAAFRVMGGRFRSVMPSDLAQVGAIAKESMPAAGMQYATDEKRRELARLFRRDGCHHCGTRKGAMVGDHMPPNKHVREAAEAYSSRRRLFSFLPIMKSRYIRKGMQALGVPVGPPLQRYYPQCRPCSQLQAAAVRSGKRALVLHEILHSGGTSTAWHYAGVVVGLRHYSSSNGSSGSSGTKNNSNTSSRYFRR